MKKCDSLMKEINFVAKSNNIKSLKGTKKKKELKNCL